MKKIFIVTCLICAFILLSVFIGYLYHINSKSAQAIEKETTGQTYPETDSGKCGDEENKENDSDEVCGKAVSHSSTSKLVNILKDDSINKHLD
jgi:hypothetical protein